VADVIGARRPVCAEGTVDRLVTRELLLQPPLGSQLQGRLSLRPGRVLLEDVDLGEPVVAPERRDRGCPSQDAVRMLPGRSEMPRDETFSEIGFSTAIYTKRGLAA
jgi:hypothetical protein